jgi:hypothetical protein
MPISRKFVAVDWRAGKDKCFFFFKDTNTYSRFDLGDNRVPEGYPKPIKHNNWHDFHVHAKNLKFGFADTSAYDQDVLWLFYYDASTPMACKYDQDADKVISNKLVKYTIWEKILPYFDNIIAGTRWGQTYNERPFLFRFIMNNGHSLYIDQSMGQPNNDPFFDVEPINDSTWPGLKPYKNRIITAVQNDRSLADSYLYIFLTNNEYITYNIPQNKVEYGPYNVSDVTWPGLVLPSISERPDTASGPGVSDTEFNFVNSHDER